MTPQKKPRPWTWIAAFFMTMLVADMCALTWYLWDLPTADSQRWEKTIATMAGWIVSIMAFWGIKHATKRQMSLAQFISLPPVRLSTIGVTLAIWFFVVPFHSVTVLVRGPDGSPLAGAMATVDHMTQPSDSDSRGFLRIGSLGARTHTIEVRKTGYNPREFSAGVADVLTMKELHPSPLELAEQMVTIKSDPPGAALYVDKETEPRCEAGNPIPLPIGAHIMALKLPGYLFTPVRIDVRADMPPVTYHLQKVSIPPQKPFPLAVGSDPLGAEVWVDGKLQGHTPGTVWLRAGERVIELRKQGYETFRESVSIPERKMYSPKEPLKQLADR
jgi:hypothetical protein